MRRSGSRPKRTCTSTAPSTPMNSTPSASESRRLKLCRSSWISRRSPATAYSRRASAPGSVIARTRSRSGWPSGPATYRAAASSPGASAAGSAASHSEDERRSTCAPSAICQYQPDSGCSKRGSPSLQAQLQLAVRVQLAARHQAFEQNPEPGIEIALDRLAEQGRERIAAGAQPERAPDRGARDQAKGKRVTAHSRAAAAGSRARARSRSRRSRASCAGARRTPR